MTYHAETRVLKVDAQQPDPEAIAEAARVLRRGGLVAFPTETVYGLGANALDSEAAARIFAAKGRPATDPLIVHIAAPEQLEQVAADVPALARELAARFWPGPLTLILRRNPAIAANVSAGGETVGVRMPRHPVALALLSASGLPVAAPSANLFARPSPTTAQHVLDDLRGRVDIVLDAGTTEVGVESTVLDITQTPPRVLRPGGVSLEALRALLPDVTYTPRYLQEEEAAAAPGMLLKHYSPRAKLTVYSGSRDAVLAAMQQKARDLAAGGQRVGILASEADVAALAPFAAEIISLGEAGDTEQMARMLFAALREMDARGVDVILARAPRLEGLGLAVFDRLVRAAEGDLIEIE